MTDIAQLGYAVDSSQLTKGTVALDKHTSAAQRTDTATAKLDKQFKQLKRTEWEMSMLNRQLPMQFTDIATSLATGQRPMMVFLQQGGQIKDMAGGIVPALRAMGGYVMSLVNPFTVAAGAAGLLIAAWKSGVDDAAAFNLALLTTGNYADKTSAQLEGMVDRLADLQGVTAGQARDALLQVAQSGRFTGEQFDMVSTAAARMEAATGQAIEDTIKKFVQIEKDPVKALLKLNETEHFLTQTQLDRINGLVDEQREQDAAALGAKVYADRLNEIADAAEKARPHLSRMWQETKEEASKAWEATKDFAEFLAATAAKTQQRPWWQRTGLLGAVNFLRDMQDAQPAAPVEIPKVQGAVDSKQEEAERKAREQAAREFEQFRSRSLEKAVRLEEEIKKMREAGLKLGKGEVELAKVEAQMRARFAESQSKRQKADPTESIISRLQDRIALNEAAAASEDQLTETERMLVQVQTELERIAAKTTITNRGLIDSLIEKARATDKDAQATERQRQVEKAMLRLREQTALAEANQRRANEIDLLGMGRGAEATEMLRRQLELHRWYEDQVTQLRRQAALEKREITAEEEQELEDSLQRQLDEERRYQEERQRLMGDWKIGASAALENYIERSRDVAGQWQDIWGEAFATFEDLGVDALTGNLDDWGAYFDNLHAMIARFLIRQQLTKWMQTLFVGGNTSSDAGTIFDLLGSFGSGGFFGGGRANGGDVRDDRIYRVGERDRPELATIGGHQFLIPGDRGNVEPIRGRTSGARPIQVTQNIYTTGAIDPRTATQQQQEAGMKLRTAMARNN